MFQNVQLVMQNQYHMNVIFNLLTRTATDAARRLQLYHKLYPIFNKTTEQYIMVTPRYDGNHGYSYRHRILSIIVSSVA